MTFSWRGGSAASAPSRRRCRGGCTRRSAGLENRSFGTRVRSSAAEHRLHTAGVTGSIPVAPTIDANDPARRTACCSRAKIPSRSRSRAAAHLLGTTHVTATLARIGFDRAGNGRNCLVSGWSVPEKRHTWAVGHHSTLRLEFGPVAGGLMLEFNLSPFVAAGVHPSQRIFITVNDRPVGAETLESATWIGYSLPRDLLARDGGLEVRFDCPDATAPASVGVSADHRQLAFALREATIRDIPPPGKFARTKRACLPIQLYNDSAAHRAIVRGVTGLSVADLALCFESLGTGCEFGLFQRECGVEPLGLLRFAGLPYSELVSAMQCGFAGIEDDKSLTCHVAGSTPEWMVQTTVHRLRYHTFRSPADVTAEQLLAEQSRILKFRREKLLELLATGEKLFTVRHQCDLTAAQVLPLLSALRCHGPGTLLFASRRTGLPAGTVEMLAPDLLVGSLDGIETITDEDERVGQDTWLSREGMTAWLSICANAYQLWASVTK